MIDMLGNVFYFDTLNDIGGVESFLYYIARCYNKYDITIYYKVGNPKQVERLTKLVRVRKYHDGQKIVCDKIFFAYYFAEMIDNVEANEYCFIVHADYGVIGKKYPPITHPKITKYYGVSQVACDSFTKLTGIPVELLYNPISLSGLKRTLLLVSATRLTFEKGSKRIDKLATALEQYGIPYIWIIFTDRSHGELPGHNIVYMQPTLDVISYLKNADYVVQLSDTEAFCYTVVESLMLGTPVIVTDCPVFKEIGVVNGENGFIVNFDMTDLPIKDIYEKELKFDYQPPKTNWDKVLSHKKSNYPPEKLTVRCIKPYYDMALLKNISPSDEPYQVSLSRAAYLSSIDLVRIEE